MGQVPRSGGVSSSSRTWMGLKLRHIALILLTVQYTAFALTLHHSRTMPLVHGHRYLPSTALLLSELLKLSTSLTISLYYLSRSIPSSMPATSLFQALSTAIFSGDSYKIALPAALYTLSNSLQYVALGNLGPGSWMVSMQVKVVVCAAVGWLFGGRMPKGKGKRVGVSLVGLVLLLVGVGIVQLAIAEPRDPMDDENMRLYIPQSVAEWREMGGAVAADNVMNVKRNVKKIMKRSATYQGIEDDLMMENPRVDSVTGFLATLASCLAAGVAGVYFEKVIRDSSTASATPNAANSLWVRNVQLAIYSLFPALFIGVVFLDGEKIARSGFFEGYNWVVWASVGTQAAGGIATAFCLRYADQSVKNLASGSSVVLSVLGGWWFFGYKISAEFILGTLLVLVSLYIYTTTNPSTTQNIFSPPPPPFITRPHRSRSVLQNNPNRPPPIQLHSTNNKNHTSHHPYSDTPSPDNNLDENDRRDGEGDDEEYPEPKDFSIKLPTTPLISEATGAESRPGSPVVRYSHSRGGSNLKAGEKGGYFGN